MKIYLASSFDQKDKVERISKILEDLGHEIVVKWWYIDFKEKVNINDDDEWYDHPDIKMVKERNYKALLESDACILVCPDDKPKAFNGANLEIGFALGKGIPCFSIGKQARSGMYGDVKRSSNINELIKNLQSLTDE